MTECTYVRGWIGKCAEPAINTSNGIGAPGEPPRCKSHINLKCVSCGRPSAGDCEQTMGPMTCGAELCSECKHDPAAGMAARHIVTTREALEARQNAGLAPRVRRPLTEAERKQADARLVRSSEARGDITVYPRMPQSERERVEAARRLEALGATQTPPQVQAGTTHGVRMAVQRHRTAKKSRRH